MATCTFTCPVPGTNNNLSTQDGPCQSRQFIVEVGYTAIIRGFEFAPDATASFEMVSGCADAPLYQHLPGLFLCACNPVVYISRPGRYRMVWCECDGHYAHVELEIVNQVLPELRVMGCDTCRPHHVPATIDSLTPVLEVTAAGQDNQAFTLDLDFCKMGVDDVACIKSFLDLKTVGARAPLYDASTISSHVLIDIDFCNMDAADIACIRAALGPFTVATRYPVEGDGSTEAPVWIDLCNLSPPLVQCLKDQIGCEVGDSHAPATITSLTPLLTVVASGLDNQTFTLDLEIPPAGGVGVRAPIIDVGSGGAQLIDIDFCLMDDVDVACILGKLPRPVYDLVCYWSGTLEDMEFLLRFKVVRPFRIAANLAGSRGVVTTLPATESTLIVGLNNVQIGSIVVATDGSMTFSTVAGPYELVPGDVVDILAAPGVDTAMDGIAITIAGTRSWL